MTNALSLAFGFSPTWLGLVVAEVICLGTVYYLDRLKPDWPIAFLNGCLVFLSAAGANGASNATLSGIKTTLPPSVMESLPELPAWLGQTVI